MFIKPTKDKLIIFFSLSAIAFVLGYFWLALILSGRKEAFDNPSIIINTTTALMTVFIWPFLFSMNYVGFFGAIIIYLILIYLLSCTVVSLYFNNVSKLNVLSESSGKGNILVFLYSLIAVLLVIDIFFLIRNPNLFLFALIIFQAACLLLVSKRNKPGYILLGLFYITRFLFSLIILLLIPTNSGLGSETTIIVSQLIYLIVSVPIIYLLYRNHKSVFSTL